MKHLRMEMDRHDELQRDMRVFFKTHGAGTPRLVWLDTHYNCYWVTSEFTVLPDCELRRVEWDGTAWWDKGKEATP